MPDMAFAQAAAGQVVADHVTLVSSATHITSGSLLSVLVLAGVLGMIGQSVRAIVGLKKMRDDALTTSSSSTDLFIASRLVVSQIVGFIAGVVTALSLGVDKFLVLPDTTLMLGVAAAGYAGTDVVEAFARRLGATGNDRSTATPRITPGPKPFPSTLRTQLARNQVEAYEAALGEGLSDPAARALVANMTGESLANPTDKHFDVSHDAQGIVQWDPPRSEAIRQHFGRWPMEMSVAEQTQAAVWEIMTVPRFSKSKAAIETLSDPAQIVDVLVRNYEVPRDPGAQTVKRVAYLKDLDRVLGPAHGALA